MSKPVVPDDLAAFVAAAKAQGIVDADSVGLLRPLATWAVALVWLAYALADRAFPPVAAT